MKFPSLAKISLVIAMLTLAPLQAFAAPSVSMQCPNANQTFVAKSGNAYTTSSAGVASTVVWGDIIDLANNGCLIKPTVGALNSFLTTAQTQGANGMLPANLGLGYLHNLDGSALAAAAAAGKFGQTITLGTVQRLISEAANSNTKTDDAVFEYTLPANYVAGTNLTVTVNASITGAGTLTTKTAQIKAYRNGTDGTQAADIGPGAGVAMTAAGADVTFTITGTTLNPGDKITFELETVLTETGASNMTANINSLRIN